MAKIRNPKVVSVGGMPVTPITAKERRRMDESIKKKYEEYRRETRSYLINTLNELSG